MNWQLIVIEINKIHTFLIIVEDFAFLIQAK